MKLKKKKSNLIRKRKRKFKNQNPMWSVQVVNNNQGLNLIKDIIVNDVNIILLNKIIR